MTNLAANLRDSADRFGDRVAVRLDTEEVSYRALADRTARVAGWLAGQGLRPGDRVGIMLPNVVAFPVLYYGVLRAGGTVVPMNPLLKAREISHYLADSGARLMVGPESATAEVRLAADRVGAQGFVLDEALLAQLAAAEPGVDWAERADDDTAVILYTSGTTGAPKGAELTHANLRANAEVIATRLLELTPQDVVMGCLPLFHSFGQTCSLNAAIVSGASLTLLPRFDPAIALKIIERDRVTVFEGVPTMYVGMLHAGSSTADTGTLRHCVSGGAALPVEVLLGFEREFGAEILEGYGLSETSPVASFNRAGQARPGTIGVPIDGVQMRVVDEHGQDVPAGEVGEIVIRGHNVMKGYWNQPEATAAAIRGGWFFTGDMARRDADGYFAIVDRKKDLIIRGGYNVYPRELEEVLYEHPQVLEAAVVGVPHPTHGEEVTTVVVLKPGGVVTADELKAYVRERVAAYKYPRRVWLVESLPKGPTGKILKRAIVVPEQR